MVSLLRKRRTISRTSEQQDDQQLRPSLSLPDLTTPLLDPESWEELPSFAYDPSAGGTAHNTTPRVGRRKASIGGGGATQFHKPFSPWQIVPRTSTDDRDGDTRASTWSSRGESQDFRVSKARWGRDTIISQSSEGGYRKRRGKSKVAKRLNVVVVGGKGVGKTSFINLLFDSFEESHDDPEIPTKPTSSRNIKLPQSTPSSPTVPGPPQPSSLASAAVIHSPHSKAEFAPPSPQVGPTTRISSRSSVVGVEGYDRLQLRLVDTPGLELGAGDGLKEKERERGVAGLMRLLEDQFVEVMREESRIVRRGQKSEDNLVHLVVYLIDVRSVLHPSDDPVRVDWSTVGVFNDDSPSLAAEKVAGPKPRLDQSDIDIIRRLGERVNVLPVLTRTDTLTIQELDQVREVVRADLENAFPSHGGFGVFADPEEDDGRRTPRQRELSPEDSPDPRPPTPASTIYSSSLDKLPYAIFSPSTDSTKDGARKRFERGYSWGTADVMDAEQSDFLALREAILGTHTKVLRNSTREVLYEKYRTEKLLAKQSTKDRISSDTVKRIH